MNLPLVLVLLFGAAGTAEGLANSARAVDIEVLSVINKIPKCAVSMLTLAIRCRGLMVA